MAHLRARLLLGLLASVSSAVVGCSESHSAMGLPDAFVGGGDGGAFPDAPDATDAGPRADAAPIGDAGVMPSSCAPQDAQAIVCPSAVCDGLDQWAWDGERCIRIECGTCVGADCGHLVFAESQCRANHATCVPEMCRATGGQWLFYAQECQHYRCGTPQPAECLVGMPVCNCGDGRSFDAARGGCFDDSTCPAVDPLPPQTLCTATGGTWTTGICCATHCGEVCPLACAADNCACGPLQVFDGVRGCVDSAECHVHRTGQECNTQIRCQDGLICCQHCGGAGCDPTMTCEAPVCNAGPHIDMCGNNLLAP